MRQRTAILLSWCLGAGSASAAARQPWTSPRETDMAELQLRMGPSPSPTPPPQLRGHRLARMDLMPRLGGYTLGPGTCGVVQSNGYSIASCVYGSATCATLGGYLGCCGGNEAACSGINTVCINYVASQAGECSLPDEYHTVCCDSAAPACFSYIMTKSDSGGTFTILKCSPSGGTARLLDYDPNSLLDYDPTSLLDHDPTGPRTHSLSPSAASSSTESPLITVAAQTETVTKTSTRHVNDDAGGGGQANIGAVAGGAVGGIAVLGLVAIVGFVLLRRHRSNDEGFNTQHTSPQMAMTQTQPKNPPQKPHACIPAELGYDPHMSLYSQHAYFPQGWYDQHAPQFHGQYPSQQRGMDQTYGAVPHFAAAVAASPQAPSVTSPSTIKEGEPSSGGLTPPPAAPRHHQPSELPAVAPLGYESNRAELG